ncbi:MAG: outer membrane lipoprotein-sorting protein [Methanosarcinales archaeon]|nr:outer membrane lipoprotein-sorting protein [Methanosarcinales archaeon]
MKRQTKQIAAVLLVLAAVLISGCTDDMSADEIASRMEAKQEGIEDFSATMVMTSSFGGETETTRAKIMTKMPDKTRSEFIEPAEFAGTLTVRNGSTMWMYDPAKNQVTKMTLPEDESFEIDYTELVRDLMDENDISYKGTENVGGRSAYVIEATPKDEADRKFISKTRVWVDRENWMLLGTEMYDADGNPMVKVEYRDITFNTGVLDREFIFEVPEGAEVVEESFEDRMPETMTLDEARANLTFDLRTPSYLPEGYELDDHAMVTGGERKVVSLKYTNGDERLYLSEWISDDTEQSGMIRGEPEIVSINGTDGEITSVFGMNTLRWSADGIDYSLSGGLEKDELVNVAESMT